MWWMWTSHWNYFLNWLGEPPVFLKLKFMLNSRKKDYATNKNEVYYTHDNLSMVLLDLKDYAPKRLINFTE